MLQAVELTDNYRNVVALGRLFRKVSNRAVDMMRDSAGGLVEVFLDDIQSPAGTERSAVSGFAFGNPVREQHEHVSTIYGEALDHNVAAVVKHAERRAGGIHRGFNCPGAIQEIPGSVSRVCIKQAPSGHVDAGEEQRHEIAVLEV